MFNYYSIFKIQLHLGSKFLFLNRTSCESSYFVCFLGIQKYPRSNFWDRKKEKKKKLRVSGWSKICDEPILLNMAKSRMPKRLANIVSLLCNIPPSIWYLREKVIARVSCPKWKYVYIYKIDKNLVWKEF